MSTELAVASKGSAVASAEDAELEKRKARAARFGIPLVEIAPPKAVKASQPPQKKTMKGASAAEGEVGLFSIVAFTAVQPCNH